jgi:hypothetical protein
MTLPFVILARIPSLGFIVEYIGILERTRIPDIFVDDSEACLLTRLEDETKIDCHSEPSVSREPALDLIGGQASVRNLLHSNAE